MLVENAGRVVTKQELIDRLWPGLHVAENNLAQQVSLVRKTLAAVDAATEYVQTMPRRGYRFAAGTPKHMQRSKMLVDFIKWALADGQKFAPSSATRLCRGRWWRWSWRR